MHPAPVNTRPQFSLFALFAITALFAIVFALIAALQTPPMQALFGFVLFAGIAGAAAVIIEVAAQLLGLRRGT